MRLKSNSKHWCFSALFCWQFPPLAWRLKSMVFFVFERYSGIHLATDSCHFSSSVLDSACNRSTSMRVFAVISVGSGFFLQDPFIQMWRLVFFSERDCKQRIHVHWFFFLLCFFWQYFSSFFWCFKDTKLQSIFDVSPRGATQLCSRENRSTSLGFVDGLFYCQPLIETKDSFLWFWWHLLYCI